MKKYNLQKVSTKSIVISMIALFLAVIAIVVEIMAVHFNHSGTGFYTLAVIEIVAFVLFIAVISTKRSGFFRIISLILTVVTSLAFFISSLVEFSEFVSTFNWMDAVYLVLSLVSLIAATLNFIYFLIAKGEETNRLERLSNFILIIVISLFALSVFSKEIVQAILLENHFPELHIGLILLNLALLHLVRFLSNDKVEEAVQPVEIKEEKAEEEKENGGEKQ
jgi:carbon starvation protein CstA